MIFTMNDDRMLMEFLSGRYLGYPEAHSIYMNYPLTLLIKWLYEIAPQFDWYSFTLIGIQALCVGLLLVRFWNFRKSQKEQYRCLFMAAAVLLFAIGHNFAALTFSTVAAVTGVTTLVWYGTSRGTRTDVLISGLLAALTWCIRDELLIMILPAAGLIWLFRDFSKESSIPRKFAVPLCVLVCVGGCILWDSIAYSSADWKKFNTYNMETQTEIYDYLSDYYFPDYEQNREYFEAAGITNEERRILIYASFLYAQDELSTETLDKLVQLRENYGNTESIAWNVRVKSGTGYFLEHLREGRYGIRLQFAAAGFVLALVVFAYQKDKKAFWQTMVIAVTMCLIVWLMELRGRVPQRVADSLSMMSFAMMSLCWIWKIEELQKSKVFLHVFSVAVILLGVCGAVSVGRSIGQAAEIRKTNLEYDKIREYCQTHQDNFYIVSIGSLNRYGINVNVGTVDHSQNNYISAGDWMAYSPIQLERLEQAGISSAAESLLRDDSVYIISDEDNYLNYAVDYLESRFQKEINAKKIDVVKEGCFVYQLEFAQY